MDPTSTVQVVTDATNGGGLSGFETMFKFLEAGGPLAVAVIAGWFALRKDNEVRTLQESATARDKATYDQMVALVGAQTAALVKMEATIAALKDVIAALERRLE